MELEKTFSNDATGKGLISKVYKQLVYMSKNQKPDLKNRQKTRIDIFPKKTYKWPTGT